MSAQILLSMIAPGLPAAPQGSTGEAMGEFEALLAGMTAAAKRGGEAEALPAPPAEGPGQPDAAATGVAMPAAIAMTPTAATTLVPAAPEAPEDDAAPVAEEGAGSSISTPLAAGSPVVAEPTVGDPIVGEPVAGAEATSPAGVAAVAPTGSPRPAPTSQAASAAAGAPVVPPPAPEPVQKPDGGYVPMSPGQTASAPAGAATFAPEPAPAPAPYSDATASPTVADAAAPIPAIAAPPPSAAAAAPVASPAPAPLRAQESNAASSRDKASGSDANLADHSTSPSTPATSKQVVEGGAVSVGRPDRSGEAPPRIQADVATPDQGGSAGEGEPGPAPAPETASPAAREASASAPLVSRVAVEATAQIAAQILRKLDGRSTRFEMALLPEELGRVDVKLDIDSDGRLAARLAFDNPAAATDLRGRADELRRQLEQAGFHLAEDAFEFAERDSGSSAFDRGDDPRRGSGRAFTAAARLQAEADAVPVARWTSLSLTPAGVDLKV